MATRSRRNWRGTLITGAVLPVFFLLSLGYGLGHFVNTNFSTGPGSYAAYVAPGLLASAALQFGISEAAEPVMAGFKWQRTYEAIVASPVTTTQLLFGQLAWIAIRVSVTAALFSVVMVILGLATLPLIVVALMASVLGAVSAAAPTIAFASWAADGNAFTVMNQYVVLPMSLISGAFYPISRLPEWAQGVSWFLPLSHAVTVTRDLQSGRFPAADWWHILALLAWLCAGVAVASIQFRRRLLT